MNKEQLSSRIREIIIEYEEALSDGYKYYGGDHAVSCLVHEIEDLIDYYKEKGEK